MPEPETNQPCQYKCDSTGWQCHRPPLPDSKEGFCICHEQRDDKDEALFRKEIDEIIKKAREEDCHFEGFYFAFEMDFKEISFTHNCYFNYVVFKQNVNFWRAQFSGEMTDFSGAQFMGEETIFRNAQFLGKETRFSEAKFIGNAVFIRAIFSGVNDFNTAEFRDETNFSLAQFSGETKFEEAKFMNKVFFIKSQFEGITNFSIVKFNGELVEFSRAKFSGKQIAFNKAEIKYKIRFYGTEFGCINNSLYELELNETTQVIFNRTILNKQVYNDFRKLDLSKCLFCEINLEFCDLSLSKLSWKSRLQNESLTPEDYLSSKRPEVIDSRTRQEQASESYRMLKVNFTNRKDYEKAAICHYREWECKRKALNWRNPKEFFPWLFHWLLRLSCGYGEKLQNVLISIAVLLVAYPILFVIPGFQLCPGGEGFAVSEGINRWWGESLLIHWWWGFKHTLFNFFPLWRLTDLKPCTDLARLATGCIALVGAFMIGMFVYVFRRRLMR